MGKFGTQESEKLSSVSLSPLRVAPVTAKDHGSIDALIVLPIVEVS